MNIAKILLAIFLFHHADTTVQNRKVKSIDWEKAGVLPETNGQPLGFAGMVAGVSNDVFIVGGGANFPNGMPWMGGKKKYYNELYVYQKNSNDSLVLFRSYQLPYPIGYAATISTPKGIIVAGGENADGMSNKVLLLQWDTSTNEIITQNLPELPYPLSGAGIAAHNGMVYVAGGNMEDKTSSHLFQLDLNDPDAAWEEMPSLPQPTSHGVFVYVANDGSGALYLVGGRKINSGAPSTLYDDVYAFDLKSGKWDKKKPLPYALSAGTGAAIGGNIILFGGDAGATFHRTEELIFAIAKEKDEQRKKQLTAEKIKVQSGHPGFCGSELVYNVQRNRWNEVGCIPFDVPVTTVAVPWNGEVIIAGGEIRAGVRTPQILSAKINY